MTPPARYTPWLKGVYDVAPGLKPFGTDFGNGLLDQQWFQLDSDEPRFRANKQAALRERPGKYVQCSGLSQHLESAVLETILDLLHHDHPTRSWRASSLDELALLVQEDLAVVKREGARDSLCYLHLCSASHWAPETKIGKSFVEVHDPVPAFGRVNAVAEKLVDSMINRGPFVRFVWGVESDDRLNHHPEPPPGMDVARWQGRRFDEGRFWVRTERQITWPLPEYGAAIFTIRVGHVPDTDILRDPALKDPLVTALLGMSPEARAYKGLTEHWDQLMGLLGQG